MKLYIANLEEYKSYSFSEDIEFEKQKYQSDYIRDISKVHVDGTYSIDGSLLIVSVKIKGEATLACAYTLQDVKQKFSTSDDITFTDDKELEDENTFLLTRNEIILDDYLLSLIIASLPTKVIKKGAKIPSDGKGYRVLSEEEFLKERQEKKTSPFDVLNDLDLDK